MTLDLDTFLVALYTIVDDLYQARVAPQLLRGPGKRPTLSDSEVLTLALCAQWSRRSERAVVRYTVKYWRAYFPRLLSQSAYNRRHRRLGGLVHLGPLVAQALGAAASAYQVVDTVPVPLLRRCRGQHHRRFGAEAAIGRGGSDHDWYYGCTLLVAVTREGVITGFPLAPASTEDRWMGEAFWCWRACPLAEPSPPRALPPPLAAVGAMWGRPGRAGPDRGLAPPARAPMWPTAASAAPGGGPMGSRIMGPACSPRTTPGAGRPGYGGGSRRAGARWSKRSTPNSPRSSGCLSPEPGVPGGC
jgi:hypothetical protein